MHERLYENPNFVWLECSAVHELLQRRNPGSCDALIIYNNLLRWTLYQLDRTAVSEVDERFGADIPIVHRLEWIRDCRRRDPDQEHVSVKELDKYLKRGVALMPWTELSQQEFLEYVVPYDILCEAELLREAVALMEAVVKTPARLLKSTFRHVNSSPVISRRGSRASLPPPSPTSTRRTSAPGSPITPRKPLSRTNSLRKSITEVKLRKVAKEAAAAGGTPTAKSRPVSFAA